jgi:hypothetical protein
MAKSESTVDAAFTSLLAALDAEAAEMKESDLEVFYGWALRPPPIEPVRAQAHSALSGQVASLYEQWKSFNINETRPPPPAPVSTRVVRIGNAGPGLIRNIKGFSEGGAAKKLGVKPAKVREWLEAGTLKGYRRVSGKWKIAHKDLIEFVRNRRDLL